MADELKEMPTPEPESEASLDAQGLEAASEEQNDAENDAVEEESLQDAN